MPSSASSASICSLGAYLSVSAQAKYIVAIRVQCMEATCPLVESLAVDVWSEQRGPGLGLDVVVTRDALARLDAAGVPWQIRPTCDEGFAAVMALRSSAE